VIPTIAPFILPKALPALRRRYPELRLFLREDVTAKLVTGLKAGSLDAALIALPYPLTGIETADVGYDELLAAVPANHPMTADVSVSRAALAREALILLEDGHCLRDHALLACGVEGPRADGGEDSGFAATSLATLVQMVGSGLGVSLIPAMAVEAGLADDAPVTVRPVEGGARRVVALAWRAGSSRGMEAELLAETLRRI